MYKGFCYKWFLKKKSKSFGNKRDIVCVWSLACLVIGCTLAAHGKILVHKTLDYVFQTPNLFGWGFPLQSDLEPPSNLCNLPFFLIVYFITLIVTHILLTSGDFILPISKHYYKMWVQFTSPHSLGQWIHYFPIRSHSLWPMNSLNIQWNHLAYKDTFCYSEMKWMSIDNYRGSKWKDTCTQPKVENDGRMNACYLKA
jgi:hypothetical protein